MSIFIFQEIWPCFVQLIVDWPSYVGMAKVNILYRPQGHSFKVKVTKVISVFYDFCKYYGFDSLNDPQSWSYS